MSFSMKFPANAGNIVCQGTTITCPECVQLSNIVWVEKEQSLDEKI
jgi:hypothetical protein